MGQPLASDPELARLRALASYCILDTPFEHKFDALAALAARVARTPMGLVSLVDADRQWFKSARGLAAFRQTPREHAFCAHAVDAGAALEVGDATRDERFVDNPLVTGEPHVRFYYGHPLVDPQGHVLGTLCVLDRHPRRLNPLQRLQMRQLAGAVTALLADHREHLDDPAARADALYVGRPRGALLDAIAEQVPVQARVGEAELMRADRQPPGRVHWLAGQALDHALQRLRSGSSEIERIETEERFESVEASNDQAQAQAQAARAPRPVRLTIRRHRVGHPALPQDYLVVRARPES